MRILIVDASHAMRRVLTSILAHLGYEDVAESASGPDALMHVQSSHFGLIIADWNMAKMNVADFVRNVRVTTTARPVPLLLLATVSAGPYIARSIQADDAIDHVVKPFTVAEIEDKIVALMRR